MSFLKKLFGGGGAGKPAPEEAEEHKGYRIVATPMAEGGQFRVCGVISREIGGEVKQQRFVRADLLSSHDEAVSLTFRKGRQVIDEQGDRLFV